MNNVELSYETKKQGAKPFIPKARGKQLVQSFKNPNHNILGSEPRLYTRDGNGDKVALNAWWIDLNDLLAIIAESNTELRKLGKGPVSGIRAYVALQDEDQAGNSVPDYHTLVYVCTHSRSGNHDNILLDEVQEFVEPCPYNCNKDMTQELY
jgi:hypothetical protein